MTTFIITPENEKQLRAISSFLDLANIPSKTFTDKQKEDSTLFKLIEDEKNITESQKINLVVTKDEALVLFEFLSRFCETEHPDIFEDQAEEKTLWILEGQLQKQLAEPFLSNYLDIINEARNKVRDLEIV